MQFSHKNLIAVLSPYRTRTHISDSDRKIFRWASLLPEDTDDLPDDVLYVCWLSEVLKEGKQKEGIRFLCLSDRILDDKDLSDDMILVEENHSLS